MKGKIENNEDLLQKATELYNTSGSKEEIHFTEAGAMRRLHELEVEQIELEMINEQQILNQERESELANEKYTDLYDFSPMGYFTLTQTGKILDLNLSGAQILGRERPMLKNHLFGFFVSPESKQIFNVFIGNIFKRRTKESCVLTLNSSSDFQCYVSVTGISSGNREQCIITVVNITDRKLAERDLIDANKALSLQNEEKLKRATELFIANEELVFQTGDKARRATELIIANRELLFQNEEKEKRVAELTIANYELVFETEEKAKRAAELSIANKELLKQNEEKSKRAAQLIMANIELVFETEEKAKRAMELAIANKELLYQNEEKSKRAAELLLANKELVFQTEEKSKRADELFLANMELFLQNEEKELRAAELIIANKELVFQTEEKSKRAKELVIANKELLFQNEEKEMRVKELIIANKELNFQNQEKEKRAEELVILNRELAIQANLIKAGEGRERQANLNKESLDQLRIITEQVPGVVYQFRLNPDGSSCFPYASEAIRQIFRLSPEEVRTDATQMFKNIHPEDYLEVFKSMQNSAKNLTPWQNELRMVFDDGTTRILYNDGVPQPERDGSVLWHGFVTDITHRRKAE